MPLRRPSSVQAVSSGNRTLVELIEGVFFLVFIHVSALHIPVDQIAVFHQSIVNTLGIWDEYDCVTTRDSRLIRIRTGPNPGQLPNKGSCKGRLTP
jgi:hypothetical protein